MDQQVKRLKSLDALRGFDMLWITGGAALVGSLSETFGGSFLQIIEGQMHHVSWEGFKFFDLIFPMFIFIMGVAIPYAILPKIENNVSRTTLYKKAFKRFILLVVFGFFYNQVWHQDWANARIASVLGQIGFAYFFATIIFINFPSIKAIFIWTIGLLVVYGCIQNFIPIPTYGAGVLTQEGSVNSFLDQILTPGRLLDTTFDPEGVFNSVSAIGIALFGVLAGLTLRSTSISEKRKVMTLSVSGLICLLLAMLMGDAYPVIKKIWTSTFNLQAAGFSFLLLAAFYLVIDVLGYDKWAFYFKVIGVNSITIYLGVMYIDFEAIVRKVIGGLTIHLGAFGEIILVVSELGLIWTCLYFMYKNKIFLRV